MHQALFCRLPGSDNNTTQNNNGVWRSWLQFSYNTSTILPGEDRKNRNSLKKKFFFLLKHVSDWNRFLFSKILVLYLVTCYNVAPGWFLTWNVFPSLITPSVALRKLRFYLLLYLSKYHLDKKPEEAATTLHSNNSTQSTTLVVNTFFFTGLQIKERSYEMCDIQGLFHSSLFDPLLSTLLYAESTVSA